MSRRRRRRHRIRAALWLAAIPLAASWQIAILPLRWLALAGSLCLLIISPLAWRGLLQAAPGIVLPRRWRMAARAPRLDPRTGQMVRPDRPPVPAWLRKTIYAMDRYRCVYCKRRAGGQRDGSLVKLQLDHITPYSFGGLISLWNCATLCQHCNLVKSNYWKSDSGKVYYRAWRNAADKSMAGAILRAELRARLNPVRWIRGGRCWWIGA